MATETMPTVTLGVTESAAAEIKKFMASEEGLPVTSGLRVRVVPGGCSGFQYSLNIEEDARQGDHVLAHAATTDCGNRQSLWLSLGDGACVGCLVR